jgi:hypothetical protein
MSIGLACLSSDNLDCQPAWLQQPTSTVLWVLAASQTAKCVSEQMVYCGGDLTHPKAAETPALQTHGLQERFFLNRLQLGQDFPGLWAACKLTLTDRSLRTKEEYGRSARAENVQDCICRTTNAPRLSAHGSSSQHAELYRFMVDGIQEFSLKRHHDPKMEPEILTITEGIICCIPRFIGSSLQDKTTRRLQAWPPGN